MEVTGIECISSSPVLLKLVDTAKEWIQSTWESKASDICIVISPKVIGRNDGFVLMVSTSSPDRKVCYYAKIQEVIDSYETALVHHMMRLMKCGPDTFCFPAIEGSDGIKLGVITAEVEGFTMARALTEAQQDQFLFHDDLLSATFLLTILIQLGRFSNIPGNIDNWGLVSLENPSISFPHLALVDFSSCGGNPGFFRSADAFRDGWLKCIDKIAFEWKVTTWDKWIAHRAELLNSNKLSVVEKMAHFPFLQSQQALIELLQTACNQTTLWLQEMIHNAQQANAENIHTNILSTTDTITTADATSTEHRQSTGSNYYDSSSAQSVPSIPSVPSILTPFHYIVCPDTTGLHQHYVDMVTMHNVLVGDMNTDLAALFAWFPFPSSEQCSTGSADTTRSEIPASNPSAQTTRSAATQHTQTVFDFSYSSLDTFLHRAKTDEVPVPYAEGEVESNVALVSLLRLVVMCEMFIIHILNCLEQVNSWCKLV